MWRSFATVASANRWIARTPCGCNCMTMAQLDNLRLCADAAPPPRRPAKLKIEVKAAGLNFRDVLNALGMLQEYYATVLGITQAQDVGLRL